MFNLIQILSLDPLEQFEIVTTLQRNSLTTLLKVSNLNLTFLLVVSLIAGAFFLVGTEPKGGLSVVAEELVLFGQKIVKENLPLRRQQYTGVLLYIFLFIFLANVVGLIPYAFTVTSAFVVTFFIALAHFVGVNLIGLLHHGWGLFTILLPAGAPVAIAPFLAVIELFSYLARVLSLSIRLFANMMSGHALLKILIGFSWVMLQATSLSALLFLLPWAVVTIVMVLEILIAFLQAYVFTLLATIYISDVLASGH